MHNNPIPKRLKEARMANNVSQRELGRRLGFEISVASSRMNNYEQGKRTPDFTTLEKLAEELNVPVPYFFCKSDKMAELLCIFDKLTADQQDELLAELRKNEQKTQQ